MKQKRLSIYLVSVKGSTIRISLVNQSRESPFRSISKKLIIFLISMPKVCTVALRPLRIILPTEVMLAVQTGLVLVANFWQNQLMSTVPDLLLSIMLKMSLESYYLSPGAIAFMNLKNSALLISPDLSMSIFLNSFITSMLLFFTICFIQSSVLPALLSELWKSYFWSSQTISLRSTVPCLSLSKQVKRALLSMEVMEGSIFLTKKVKDSLSSQLLPVFFLNYAKICQRLIPFFRMPFDNFFRLWTTEESSYGFFTLFLVPLKKGWPKNQDQPIRCSSSQVKDFSRMSFNSQLSLAQQGNLKGWVLIFLMQVIQSLQGQGVLPKIIQQSSIPQLQISHFDVQGLYYRICGDMQRGVPQQRVIFFLPEISALVANPKSLTLQFAPFSRTFQGLTSL